MYECFKYKIWSWNFILCHYNEVVGEKKQCINCRRPTVEISAYQHHTSCVCHTFYITGGKIRRSLLLLFLQVPMHRPLTNAKRSEPPKEYHTSRSVLILVSSLVRTTPVRRYVKKKRWNLMDVVMPSRNPRKSYRSKAAHPPDNWHIGRWRRYYHPLSICFFSW